MLRTTDANQLKCRVVDNIYVGHSADDAKKFAKETYHIKHAGELAEDGDADEDEENKLSTIDTLKLKVYQFASKSLVTSIASD